MHDVAAVAAGGSAVIDSSKTIRIMRAWLGGTAMLALNELTGAASARAEQMRAPSERAAVVHTRTHISAACPDCGSEICDAASKQVARARMALRPRHVRQPAAA